MLLVRSKLPFHGVGNLPNRLALFPENANSEAFILKLFLQNGIPYWLAQVVVLLGKFGSFLEASVFTGHSLAESGRDLVNWLGDRVQEDGDTVDEEFYNGMMMEEKSLFHLMSFDADEYDPTFPALDRYAATGRLFLIGLIMLAKKFGLDAILSAIGERVIAAWLTDMIVNDKLVGLEQKIAEMTRQARLEADSDEQGEIALQIARNTRSSQVNEVLLQKLSLAISQNSSKHTRDILDMSRTVLTSPDEVSVHDADV